MSNWTRLALCALVGACASAPADPNPGCEAGDRGIGYPEALLRLGCDGELRPGRANWAVADGVVTLDFDPVSQGLMGRDLVAQWPPLNQPPWIGHRVEDVVVSRDRVSVAFRDPAPGIARLFADPRLAGPAAIVGDHDVRDAIDGGERGILTRHGASIEYARSIGIPVRLVAFDRAYLVALPGTSEPADSEALAAAVGADWVRWGPAGTRRPSALAWDRISADCSPAVPGPVADSTASDAGGPDRAGSGAVQTVSYPEGDLAARQLAERLASTALRGDAMATVLAALTGARSRLTVRAASAVSAGRAPSDVAAVVRVPAGSVHSCSLYAEAVQRLAGWGAKRTADGPTVLVVGETGAFAIGAGAGGLP
ncbi:MAG: hypothetical protein OXH66_18970 [Gemmatimonadetes bacterium]|nr:hypothetical protein [Gemmatimonadota bacterium]